MCARSTAVAGDDDSDGGLLFFARRRVGDLCEGVNGFFIAGSGPRSAGIVLRDGDLGEL